MHTRLVEETKDLILQANFLLMQKSSLQKAMLYVRGKTHSLVLDTEETLNQHYSYYEQNIIFPSEVAQLSRELLTVFNTLSRNHLLSPNKGYKIGFDRKDCIFFNQEKLSTTLEIDDSDLCYLNDPTVSSFFFHTPTANGTLALVKSSKKELIHIQEVTADYASKTHAVVFNKRLSGSQGFLPGIVHELGHFFHRDTMIDPASEILAWEKGQEYRNLLSPKSVISFESFRKSGLLGYHVDKDNLITTEHGLISLKKFL